MSNFKKQYRDLESRVLFELRCKVEKSKIVSKYVGNEKVLKVKLSGYTELCILHDRLTFIDNDGQQYSVFTNVSLEDLIEILEN